MKQSLQLSQQKHCVCRKKIQSPPNDNTELQNFRSQSYQLRRPYQTHLPNYLLLSNEYRTAKTPLVRAYSKVSGNNKLQKPRIRRCSLELIESEQTQNKLEVTVYKIKICLLMEQDLIVFGVPIAFVILFLVIKFVLSVPKPPVQKEEAKKIVEVPKLMPISIFYGSQQGTAAKFAKILSEEGQQHGFITDVVDLNDVQRAQKMEKGNVGIFCMATHGEGDPTDNAKAFFKYLSDKDEDHSHMKGFKFTVFGLGNTQYEHFNKMGREINKILEARGCQRVFNYGEGDDNQSLEEDFNAWKQNLWQELKTTLSDDIAAYQASGDKQGEQPSQQTGPQVNFTIEPTDQQPIDFSQRSFEESKQQFEFQTQQFMKAKYCRVTSIQQLRQNTNDGSTLHIVIDLKDSGIQYKTAQNMGVYPENDSSFVEEVASFLNLNLNDVVKCVEAELPEGAKKRRVRLPIPSPITIRQILTYFVDLSGPVMKKTLSDLSKLTSDESFKSELDRLASTQGKEEFSNQIEKNKVTIYQLLKKYAIKPTLYQLLELTPRISPRLFTIASSNIKYPDEVHLDDSLLTDTLPNNTQKVGLCSSYFSRLQEQLREGKEVFVRVDFRESSFKLPTDPTTPIIMIGPGTGIAPFIGFLQERELQEPRVGHYTLYFGCKHQDGDFIHKDLLKKYEADGVLDKLYVAFSRDQESKIYVQDLLKRNAEEFIDQLLNQKAQVYICGSTSMGKQVQATMIEILHTSNRMNEVEATNYVKELESTKRIIKELW